MAQKILKDLELLTTDRPQLPAQIKEVGLLLTDDAEVRFLNKTYRKLDKTTDVLSFSMIEDQLVDSFSFELGEIVISVQMAEKQARRFKCTFKKELLRLVVHGCLHLFGYEHVKVSPAKVKRMKDLEGQLIRKYAKAL